jgi:hypothetical protein
MPSNGKHTGFISMVANYAMLLDGCWIQEKLTRRNESGGGRYMLPTAMGSSIAQVRLDTTNFITHLSLLVSRLRARER